MKRFFIVNVRADLERSRVAEGFDQLASLRASVQVVDDRGNMFDVGLNGVTENKGLQNRHDQHEKERGSLAANMGEFLPQHGHQPVGGTTRRECFRGDDLALMILARFRGLFRDRRQARRGSNRGRLGSTFSCFRLLSRAQSGGEAACFLGTGQRHEDVFQAGRDRAECRRVLGKSKMLQDRRGSEFLTNQQVDRLAKQCGVDNFRPLPQL